MITRDLMEQIEIAVEDFNTDYDDIHLAIERDGEIEILDDNAYASYDQIRRMIIIHED